MVLYNIPLLFSLLVTLNIMFADETGTSSLSIAIVSSFHHSTTDQALLLFRSLLASPVLHAPSRYTGRTCLHACYYGLKGDFASETQLMLKFANIGVSLHRLHGSPGDNKDNSGWANLICALQVADEYFLRGLLYDHLLFVGSNLMVVGDLEKSFLRYFRPESSSAYVYCAPKLGLSVRMTIKLLSRHIKYLLF